MAANSTVVDSIVKKILILSANPNNTSELRLGEEVREIQTGLKRANKREQFEIITKSAVRVEDLRRALLDDEPQIVHFSGHGSGSDGLVLEKNSGELQLVSTTVEAAAGFQNSGIYLKKGDKVRLEPDGRIHLALRQVYTLTGLGKSIIAGELPSNGKEYNNYKNLYQLRNATGHILDLTNTNVLEKVTQGNFGQKDEFRRDWTGPDGEELDSLELNNCLLFQENSPQKGRWGMLLAQVMKKPGSAVADPFQVLEDNKLRSKDLIPVTTSKDIEFDNDGWLTFIVNDAVLSGVPKAQTEGCEASHDALKKASEILRSQGDNYKIPVGLIPLIWYSDNIGAFHVTVRYADK